MRWFCFVIELFVGWFGFIVGYFSLVFGVGFDCFVFGCGL